MSVLGVHSSVLGLDFSISRFEAQAERLKEAGFGLVEIPLSRPQDVEPRRLSVWAERQNVAVFLSLPSLPPGFDVLAQPQDALDFLERLMPVCAEAGSFALGGTVYATPGAAPARPPTQKEIDGLSRFFERASRLARGAGLKLAVAPVSRLETQLLNRASDAAWLIERVGAENLFVHLDTAAMHAEEESWQSAFEAAVPFLGCVGLAESNRGVPGRGLLDWLAAFKALAETGTSCPLVWRGKPLAELAAGRIMRRATGESPDELLESGLGFLREQARESGLDLRG